MGDGAEHMTIEGAYEELATMVEEGERLRDNITPEEGLTWKHVEWGEYCKTVIAFLDPHGKIFDKATPVGMFYDGWNIATFHWTEERIDEGEQRRRNVAGFARAVGALKAIVRLRPPPRMAKESANSALSKKQRYGSDIFLIHGHDHQAREAVARFLEKLSLSVCILHEQPNFGATIIEKFERFSDVGFAIALLTADDIGGSKSGNDGSRPRARQNVVFEFGYFIGKLGRERVCALVDNDVEKPSDLDGLVYIPLDPRGAWKLDLAKNICSVGLNVDPARLLK